MRIKANSQLFLILSLAGCVSSRTPQPGAPTPSLPPTPEPINTTPKSWSFSLMPGTVAYRVSRTAAIERFDSAARREIATNFTYESIGLTLAGDTIGFTAAVDTFSTTTQGAIGSVQPTQLPIQLSGSLIGDSLVISADSLTPKCSPVATALITDLHNLVPRIPNSLSTGSSWRDSTSLEGCQASIPTKSHVIRLFRVIGESTLEGVPVVTIQRTDTIQAAGEGAQQQHHLLLNAAGTGAATYYVDISNGRVLHLSVSQDLNLTVTASGKTNHFRQNVKQEFSLVR